MSWSLERYLLPAVLISTAVPLSAENYHSWCTLHFDAAQTANGLASPMRDVDLDGLSNLLEYFADTDPWNAASALQLVPGVDPFSISFPMALDRDDIEYFVLASSDMNGWSESAVLLCGGAEVSWSLGGPAFSKVGVRRRPGAMIDSDQDGLDDFFEEALVDADPNDAITHIGEVMPGDDFDGDGTDNIDEDDNAPAPPPGGTLGKPVFLPASEVACLLDATTPAPPSGLVVHTPLR